MLEKLGDHYMLVSILVLLAILGGFLVHVERKRLRAREITLMAVMTALCVVLNEICAHTVPLHAGTTMVVISGIALGPEAGALIGAISRFLCNFFDGQGPWTPWEMAAWGLLGSLSGIAFNKVEVRKRVPGERQTLAQSLSLKKEYGFRFMMTSVLSVLAAWLAAYVSFLLGLRQEGESFWGWRLYVFGVVGLVCGSLLQRRRLSADAYTTTIFTFLTVFIIYGGMMNFAAMLLAAAADSSAEISLSALRALYISGVPYDLEHAGTASFCMFLLGDGILQRLQRLQIKFGIYIG